MNKHYEELEDGTPVILYESIPVPADNCTKCGEFYGENKWDLLTHHATRDTEDWLCSSCEEIVYYEGLSEEEKASYQP